jgi:hypothetical protein
VPHVHDTSGKALAEAGVKGEQWDPNHQREQQKLNNEGGCNTSNSMCHEMHLVPCSASHTDMHIPALVQQLNTYLQSEC